MGLRVSGDPLDSVCLWLAKLVRLVSVVCHRSFFASGSRCAIKHPKDTETCQSDNQRNSSVRAVAKRRIPDPLSIHVIARHTGSCHDVSLQNRTYLTSHHQRILRISQHTRHCRRLQARMRAVDKRGPLQNKHKASIRRNYSKPVCNSTKQRRCQREAQ